jgi:high-affinity K+ transport system ATPase subunit B
MNTKSTKVLVSKRPADPRSLKQSIFKLNPLKMLRNPVMFAVEVGTAVMLGVCIWILAGEQSQGSFSYNITVFLILLLTLLFANFAEAIAEARGKAQADSLRKTREETPQNFGMPMAPPGASVPANSRKATCSSASQAIWCPPMARSSRASPPSTKAPSQAKVRR